MNTNDALAALIDSAINESSPPKLDGVAWNELLQLAVSHRVEALTLPALPTNDIPSDVLAAWQQRAMVSTLRQIQVTDELYTTLAALDTSGVRPVVLKGVVLKALYPDPDARVMSDADLLVSPDEFTKARDLLVEFGYAKDDDDSSDDVFVCGNESGLRIELHKRLFDKKKQGFLARLNEDELFPVAAAVLVEGSGGSVMSFTPTLHLLFEILHMAKHMIVTGFGLRQIADFALSVKKFEGVDWQFIMDKSRELELVPFVDALLYICSSRLSIDCSKATEAGFMADAHAAEQCGENLLIDSVAAGVFGKSTSERERSAAVVYRAFDSEIATNEGTIARLRRAIFIRHDELHPPYMYAAQRKWLMPVVWTHRLAKYAFTRKRSAGEAVASMHLAATRLELLKHLQMIK